MTSSLTLLVAGVDLRLEDGDSRHDDGRESAGPQKRRRLRRPRLSVASSVAQSATQRRRRSTSL